MDDFMDAMEEASRIYTTVNEYRQLSDRISSMIEQLKAMLFEMLFSFFGNVANHA